MQFTVDVYLHFSEVIAIILFGWRVLKYLHMFDLKIELRHADNKHSIEQLQKDVTQIKTDTASTTRKIYSIERDVAVLKART